MKTNYNVLKTIAIALLFSTASWGQATIAQWNFNGATASTVPGGTSNPSTAIGAGTLELVGGVTVTNPATDFPSGAATGGSSDPVVTTPNTNFAWGTTNYAPQGTENKQRGIQINVSTLGYADITLRFDQRLSNTANNTYVVQYTTDRTATTPVWVDAQTFTFPQGVTGTTGGDKWYNLRTADLSAIAEIDNNANAAFRIVSAFDPIAGTYLSATAPTDTSPTVYAVTGTSRFDMITVSAATTLATSTFRNNQNKFVVTPNPVRDNMIYFKESSNITIYDVTGKRVQQANEVKELNVSSLNAGVYFVKNSEGQMIKLVKE